MDEVVETPSDRTKEMQKTIVTLDIEAPKSTKGGEAEHLGSAEKAQHDHDKDDPGTMA
jgi:hypothetical protein